MKKALSLLLAALLVFALCACGSADTPSSAPAASYDMAYTEDAYPAEAEEYGGFAVTGGTQLESGSGAAPEGSPEKLIYSASATVETTEFDGTIEKLSALVEQYGGFVESSSVNGSNYYTQSRGYSSTRYASYVIRVPSEKFSALMGSLSTLGNVPYSHTYTENITAQYYDTDARLTAYQTQEARLLEMMEAAKTVEDLIAIEEKLTELRYQIESLQSTLKNWDRQVAYSTLDLEVQEVVEYTPESRMSYGQELALALCSGLKRTGEFFKDLLLAIVGALPALVILAVVLAILIPVWKKRRKARKARKNPPAEKPKEE
ncbi:MAG: DUF4349 domain-containing protein [Candidatus Limivicinus sp.]|nr:DUF4349 domain-containing protein [Candidatus Limivicinus sp.]